MLNFFDPAFMSCISGALPVEWLDGVSVGNMDNSANWQEISGLATPQRAANSGYIWAQSDGSVDLLLAIDVSDASNAGEWTLTGINGTDYEDLASATVGGVPYIYLADFGDNANARATIDIYRIVEPTITGSNGVVDAGDITRITCQYPGGGDAPTHKDAECLLVDPDTGDMYIITKREAIPGVYYLAHAASYVGTQTLTYLGKMTDIPDASSTAATGNVVGGTISPDGTEILVKNYANVFHFPRNKATQTIYQALTGSYTTVTAYVGGGVQTSHPSQEPQGEAICFDPTGRDFYTASEYVAASGSTASAYPLFYYERASKAATVIQFQDGVLPTAAYAGTLDTYIWSLNPNTSYGTDATFVSDINVVPTDVRYGLIKFDVSDIPAGATIIGAYLDLYIQTEGQGWALHRILSVDWNESSTYNSVSGPIALDDVDAAAAFDCDIGRNLDTLTIHTRNNVPVSTIQGWVDTPASNYGWIVVPTHASDGQQHSSRQDPTTSQRPRLYIRYIV